MKKTINVVGYFLAFIFVIYVPSYAQTIGTGRLTVSFETSAGRTGDDSDLSEIKAEAEAQGFLFPARGRLSHRSITQGLTASFRLNPRFTVAGHVLVGRVNNPIETYFGTEGRGGRDSRAIDYYAEYGGRALDLDTRLEVTMSKKSALIVGYGNFGMNVEAVDRFSIDGTIWEYRQKIRRGHDGVYVGLKNEGRHKRIFFGSTAALYPTLFRRDGVDAGYINGTSRHERSTTRAWGVGLSGSIGVELHKKLGVEMFGRLRSINAPSGNRLQYVDRTVPVSTFYATYGIRTVYSLR